MVKTLSIWRVSEMKDVFQHLNKIPVEIRREWGIPHKDYTFAVDVCTALLKKLERESKRVNHARSREQ